MTVKIELSRLRQIGWEHWNPIGLAREIACEDEYDSYLLRVVGMLQAGARNELAADYLNTIATENMGLEDRTEAGRLASRRTVEAIAAYIGNLPSGQVEIR